MLDFPDIQQRRKLARIFAIKMKDLDLSVRTYNCLRRAGILFLGDLIQKTEYDLLRIKNFGEGCLQEIEQLLKKLDLRLGVDIFDKSILSEVNNRSATSEKKAKKILSHQIEELNFSVRTINCLRSEKIYYVSDLIKYSKSQLLSIPYFGKKCLFEVVNELVKLNVPLDMPISDFNVPLDMPISDFNVPLDMLISDFNSSQERKISPNNLEEELKNVASSIKGERDQQIVMKYLGWDGKGKKTLESVAQGYGLSRERVRQIYTKLEKKAKTLIAVKNAEYSKLESALKYITDHLPSGTDQIELGLTREGITKTNFNIEGIESASKLLGKTYDFTILKMNGKHIALSQKDLEIPKIVMNLTKKNIAKNVIANVIDIIEHVNEKMKRNFSEDFIKSIVSAHEDFKWLDKSSGWFWFQSLKGNRLINIIKKILSVAYSIDISELRAGISRFHRMSGLAPIRRVLLELCKQIQWCAVKGTIIELKKQISWKQALRGTTEWAFASILKESGPVMQREELEKECVDLGMNLNTFYQNLTFSPILCKYATGVYGLRGTKVPPGLVESLIPKKKRVVTTDYGWTSDGSIWITRKLNKSAILSGVIGIPSAMKEHLQGIFKCKTADGIQIGTIKIKECAGWGLGSFFRRRGGEVDEHLLLIFNIVKKETKIYIGDEDILDNRILSLSSLNSH